jgi:mannose/fructose/N-acetylgalactosamine-specific phosphotransferase system component IIB
MISLIRIDDRLIHAQVVIGWGRVLHPDRIVIADDDVAASDWEQSLYTAATPPEIKVSILTLEETVRQSKGGVFDREKLILLVGHPRSILGLMDLGLEIETVNVGGLHYGKGKEKFLDHVYLDEGEKSALRELVKRGVTLEARALPESEPVILNSKVV